MSANKNMNKSENPERPLAPSRQGGAHSAPKLRIIDNELIIAPDQHFSIEEGEGDLVPESLIAPISIDELPIDVTISIDRTEYPMSFRIRRIGEGEAVVTIGDTMAAKWWVGVLGIHTWGEMMVASVESQPDFPATIYVDQYEDEGDWLHLFVSVGVHGKTFGDVIAAAKQRMEKVEDPLNAATEVALKELKRLKALKANSAGK